MARIKRITNIEWYPRAINRPRIEVEFDGPAPKQEEFKYLCKVEEQGTMYYSLPVGDEVDYMFHNPHNERGYGGRVYKLNMLDGRVVEVKGPWSSRNGGLNGPDYNPHGPWLAEVVGTDYRSTAVLADSLIRVAAQQGIKLVWVNEAGEWNLEPVDPVTGKLKEFYRPEVIQATMPAN